MVNDPFRALSHPIRRGIVERLAAGPATVGDATGGFGVSKPAISKHLKVLERAGLISRDRAAQKRPSRLEVERLRAATQWMESYRKIWEARMDRIEIQLEKLQQEQKEGQNK